MREQLELFDLIPDDRTEKLEKYLRCQIDLNPFWYPTAKQIVQISDYFGVSGRNPLEIVEKIWKEKSVSAGDECGNNENEF